MEKRTFSREEAEQIFAGAARRQQELKQELDSRLTIGELEAAARDAGIDPRFVREAVADMLKPHGTSHSRTFLGIPVEIRESRIVAVEATDLDWGSVVVGLRSLFGKQGIATDLGTVREWSSDASEANMPTRILVAPDGNDTRVTMERKTWPSVAGILTGAATTLAAGLIIAGVWIANGAAGNIWIAATVLTVFALFFGGIGYAALRRDGRKTIERFQETLRLIQNSSASNATSRQLDESLTDSSAEQVERLSRGRLEVEEENPDNPVASVNTGRRRESER